MKHLHMFENYNSASELKEYVVNWFDKKGAEWKPPHEIKFKIKGGYCRTFFQPYQGGWILISNLYQEKNNIMKKRLFHPVSIRTNPDELSNELEKYYQKINSGLERWIKKIWKKYFDHFDFTDFENGNRIINFQDFAQKTPGQQTED